MSDMGSLEPFYVLSWDSPYGTFYGIFTRDEYHTFYQMPFTIEWVGHADSEKTVAETWINQKEFPASVEQSYLTSFDYA